ncbi:histone deacetylase [Pelagicoccus sp. SDUM812002]|uniref:histone deacetylase family protein n=1 Tax=Pelagicoccus sp. SDUM812002 TaxID=3041266 RepID=UPI00280DD0B8|nr:histone deacetylase [Pelagicoccus sp. SDUM812002]MDQ8186779.1 histone deacetylase [Pelagicoccus sp. SDUM812002]
MLPLYYHPIYTEGIHPSARFPRDRYRLLAERLEGNPAIEIRSPRRAMRDELALAHDTDYIDAFLGGQLSEKEVRRIGLKPWTPAIVERTQRIAGGSLQALEQVLETGGIAGNMAGGTHHAYRNFGSGYCIFNDVAICAFAALQRPEIKRVLSLDLDVHQGDGTASILAHEPGVFTCSIHAQSNFPFRKQKSDLDVGLEDNIGDDAYMSCLEKTLKQIQPDRFDLILFQAGVDTLEVDALGNLCLSHEGLRRRNRRALELNERNHTPLVILMGGGYAKPIARTIDAFEDLFTTAAQYC